MRKHTPGRLLVYGLAVVAVAALAIAGAASGNHWADYNGTADSHELTDGNPPLCPQTQGGLSFRLDADDGELKEGVYPADNPAVRIFDLDIDGGTLSWELVDEGLHLYDVAAVVMKGGPNAIVYHYDVGNGGHDDSDAGITTPINTNGNVDPRPYGISHVDFCFDPKDDNGPKHLVVTKTADTSWERAYTWDVEKSVDNSQIEMKQGGTATAQWKVDVTQTGSTVQNAEVNGTIDVSNPNAFDVTGVTVTDALAGAVVDCDGAAGAPVVSTGLTVPANGSLQCSYSATRDSLGGGTNWAAAAATLDGVDLSGAGWVDYSFGSEPSAEINKTREGGRRQEHLERHREHDVLHVRRAVRHAPAPVARTS